MAAIAALTACAPVVHHPNERVNKHVVVHEYRSHVSSVDTSEFGTTLTYDQNMWIYWYYIFDSSDRPMYYYRSDTPITNYSNVSFTKVNGELPKDAEEAIVEGEVEVSQNVDVEALPEAVQADTTDAQIDAMVSEGGPPTPEAESAPSADSSESTSSDSGSSSDGGSSD